MQDEYLRGDFDHEKMFAAAVGMMLSLSITGVAFAQETESEASSTALAIYFLYADNTEGKENPGVEAVSSATPYTDIEVSDLSVMTELLEEELGLDTYAIVANEKYDADFDAMVDGAKMDITDDRAFTFEEDIPDLSGYTDIYLGIPVWWGTFPQPVRSFLEQEEIDLSGKTIHFYNTHLGSRFGNMIEQLGALQSGAVLAEDPFTISASDDIREHEEDFVEWIREQ